jgi:DNA repair protein RadD
MGRIQPRYYQEEAREAIYAFFSSHSDVSRNPVVAMPTGTGKSVVIADFIQSILYTWPHQRVMMLTHVKELIEQNALKMLNMWPNAPLGIFSAGLGRKDAHMPITFAGIQSAAKVAHLFGRQDLVIIDECHLVSPNENAIYKKFLAMLFKANPNLRVIGLSATPYRLGLGSITEGGIFTDICYDITGRSAFIRLLDEGYLAPLIPMATKTQFDLGNVHKKGGEFVASELQQVVLADGLTRIAVLEGIQAAKDRNHWLIFATGIDHVLMIHAILEEQGISATYIHSKLNAVDRNERLRQFKAGEKQALVNADILTTGFDFEALDCIMFFRPTASPVLHVQMSGRGTRPFYASGFDLSTTEGRLAAIAASSKKNCLVLDFAGNTQRLGPINDPRIPKKKGEGAGEAPIKVCSTCGCLNHISVRVCDNCGALFEFKERLTPTASTEELIVRDTPVIKEFEVDRITYMKHHRHGKIPSLKVSYYSGMRRFTEWICLQHEGSPIQRKAHAWWRKRIDSDPPSLIEDALLQVNDLAVPVKIRVWINCQHPEVLGHEFKL